MMLWQKLTVAGMAAIGAAMIATPAPAASGFQSHAYRLLGQADSKPEVSLVSHRGNWRRNRWHNRHWRRNNWRGNNWRRNRWDNGVSIGIGVPLFAFGAAPFYGGSRYYYDDFEEDSWLHCHGRKFWRNGRLRCTGRWHRHWN